MAHEYREANQVADKLANWAVKNDEKKIWIDRHNIPWEILDLIERVRITGRLGNIECQLLCAMGNVPKIDV